MDWCQVVFDLAFCVPWPNKPHKCNWIQGTDWSSMHSWVSKLSDAHKREVNKMDGWIRSFMRAGTTLNWSWWLNQLKYIIEMDITWIQTWQLLIVLGRQLHWIIWLWQFLMLKLKCFEFSGSIICDKWCKTKYFQWNLHSSLTKWIPVCKYPDKGPPSPSPCQTQHVYPNQQGVTLWHYLTIGLLSWWPQSTN